MDIWWISFISVSVLYIVNANDNLVTLDGIKYVQPKNESWKNWIGAQNSCGAQGGHLVEISNERIERVITGFLGADASVWVGGIKTNMPYMVWIGQTEPVQPQLTGFLPPNPNKPLSNCAHMDVMEQQIYVYDSIYCENQLKFICQDKGCDITNFSCKVMPPSTQALTWDEAKQKCEELNLQLLVLPDEIRIELPAQNNKQIWPKLKNIPQSQYWIGLHFLGWKWTSGDYITFSGGNQIRNNLETNKNCLIIWQNGTWQPADCNEPHGFVCQKGKPVSEKNTPTTSVSTQSSSTTVTTAVTEQNEMESDVLNEPSTPKHAVVIGVSVGAVIFLVVGIIVGVIVVMKRKGKVPHLPSALKFEGSNKTTTLKTGTSNNSKAVHSTTQEPTYEDIEEKNHEMGPSNSLVIPTDETKSLSKSTLNSVMVSPTSSQSQYENVTSLKLPVEAKHFLERSGKPESNLRMSSNPKYENVLKLNQQSDSMSQEGSDSGDDYVPVEPIASPNKNRNPVLFKPKSRPKHSLNDIKNNESSSLSTIRYENIPPDPLYVNDHPGESMERRDPGLYETLNPDDRYVPEPYSVLPVPSSQ